MNPQPMLMNYILSGMDLHGDGQANVLWGGSSLVLWQLWPRVAGMVHGQSEE